MKPSPTAIAKRIAESQNVPQHRRIAAVQLLGIETPAALLNRIVRDHTAPGRLRGLCADLLLQKIALAQIEKEASV